MPGQQEDNEDEQHKGLEYSNGHYVSEGEDSSLSGEVTSKVVPERQEDDDKISGLTELNEQLSTEIRALKAENEAFSQSVKGLEIQVRENADKLDALVSSNKQAEAKQSELQVQVSAARDEASSSQQEKVLLESERDGLKAEKQELEAALAQSSLNISELSKKVDDAECAAASAKEKVERLEAEVVRISGERDALASTNESLKALSAQTLSELNTVKACKEQERDRMVEELRRAVEEACSLRNSLDMAKAAEESYKSKISMLEGEFVSSAQRIIELEVQGRERVGRVSQLEARVSELEHQLGDAAVEKNSLLEALNKEKELRTSVEEEMRKLASRKQVLEDEVKSALVTINSMQDITQKEQSQRKILEDQVASVLREKGLLEEAKGALEVELKGVSAAASKAAVASQAEVLSLKQKTEGLEMALGRVKEEAHSSEKKVWQLLSEIRAVKDALESRSSVLRFVLPSAIVSTAALAVLGVCGYVSYKRSASS